TLLVLWASTSLLSASFIQRSISLFVAPAGCFSSSTFGVAGFVSEREGLEILRAGAAEATSVFFLPSAGAGTLAFAESGADAVLALTADGMWRISVTEATSRAGAIFSVTPEAERLRRGRGRDSLERPT